jgi:hypothetical protein
MYVLCDQRERSGLAKFNCLRLQAECILRPVVNGRSSQHDRTIKDAAVGDGATLSA